MSNTFQGILLTLSSKQECCIKDCREYGEPDEVFGVHEMKLETYKCDNPDRPRA